MHIYDRFSEAHQTIRVPNLNSDEIIPVSNTTEDSELISLTTVNENRSFGWVESPDYPKIMLHKIKTTFGNFSYLLYQKDHE